MKKHEADRIIEEYVKPIYGFSMNKTRNMKEAEELASRIMLQVYAVLMKKDSFVDLNSYIFKIAHNVWTRYLDDQSKTLNNVSIDETSLSSDSELDHQLLQNEVSGKLRLEIAFLSNQQREIVILHYYKGLKIREIAEKLNLPEGTIKWHLYESKKEMKKGMEVIRTVGSLGINPIRFSSMGHDGEPGKKGDTEDFLRKSITQNIAYAAYHEPLTINQIAEELGLSPAFAEDEIKELEEYGFMDKLPAGKYQTNMLIIENTESKWEAMHSLYKEYAEQLVEAYFLQFFSMEQQFKDLQIYYPDNDFNLLLWSVIPYAMSRLSFPELAKISFDEVSTLRKDGGNYIAVGIIQKEMEKSDPFNYSFCGDMYRADENQYMLGWQLNTVWSNREMDWRDNMTSDFVGVYHFINGDLAENHVNIDVYRRLIDKGYLIRTENGYQVNLVYCANKELTDKLRGILPSPSEELVKLGERFDRAVYEIERVGQPIHMLKTIRYRCQNRLAALKTYVLKNLVERGLLKETTAEAGKGISTILFVER